MCTLRFRKRRGSSELLKFITRTLERGVSKGEGKGKGKAIPLHVLTGPEGSRKLRLPDFKIIGT
jgi:hypothetical protein